MTDPWAVVSAVGGSVGAVTGLAALGISIWSASSSGKSAAAAVSSASAAQESAESAATTAQIEGKRHHTELTPELEFAFVVDNGQVGSTTATPGATAKLTITLRKPHDLHGLTVAIRDDRPDRTPRTAGRPTAEDIAATIWGPWRFRPGVDGAADDGRQVPARPLARLDTMHFVLDPSLVPDWSTAEDWARVYANSPLRLLVTCTRDGDQPWELRQDVLPTPLHDLPMIVRRPRSTR